MIKVAIDGPSGSGKSSTAKGLARRGGWEYLDTGALYRMVTSLAIRNTEKSLEGLFETLDEHHFEVSTDPDNQFFLIDGVDSSAFIREAPVTARVSEIAAHPLVREYLFRLQRHLIDKAIRGIVVEGRDICSVVMPEANFKLFLEAHLGARASRRSAELGHENDSNTARDLAERDQKDSNRALSPLAVAADAIVVDSSEMNLEETIEHIWTMMRESGALGLPRIAVVGRPNVGKSSLINRLTGRNDAITEDRPGITRDAVEHLASWNSRDFILVDTGGWDRNANGIDGEVAERALEEIEDCDMVLFVVDAHTGALSEDEEMISLVRKFDKEVFLVANKVDNEGDESNAYALWNLGLGEPHFISALHGRGSGDLLDKLINALPEVGKGKRRDLMDCLAILGKPNVGKSSLLNVLAGEKRALVDSVAGTTRDPIDEIVSLDGRELRLIDTAGIRRRSHQDEGADYFSILRTEKALERADLALLLIDASQVITEQDLRLISMVEDSGKAIVIVMNKWDLVEEERRLQLERESERAFNQVLWAERINISAKTGWHKDRLLPAIERALASWKTRIPTGRLNAFIGAIVAENPLPVRGGKQAKIQYCVQASSTPPTFILFATGFIEASYRRFIERRLREEFGFVGSPIRISIRLKDNDRSS